MDSKTTTMVFIMTIKSLFLMMGMVSGSCTNWGSDVWSCRGNSTAGVPSSVAHITMYLMGNNSLDFKSMSNLTNLMFIRLDQYASRVLKSSDFAVFPNLANLEVSGGKIKLKEVELTGMIIF